MQQRYTTAILYYTAGVSFVNEVATTTEYPYDHFAAGGSETCEPIHSRRLRSTEGAHSLAVATSVALQRHHAVNQSHRIPSSARPFNTNTCLLHFLLLLQLGMSTCAKAISLDLKL